MSKDEKRLLWIVKGAGIDGFGETDIHEIAAGEAAVNDREEPNDADYLFAVRWAIDRAQDKPSPQPRLPKEGE